MGERHDAGQDRDGVKTDSQGKEPSVILSSPTRKTRSGVPARKRQKTTVNLHPVKDRDMRCITKGEQRVWYALQADLSSRDYRVG